MTFQKITLALTVAVAASSALACTGTHEATAKSATPDLHAASVGQEGASPAVTGISPSMAAADTDTVRRAAALAVGSHPTPPVLDSLIKGTLPARGLYVFRFAANARRLLRL